METDRLRYFCAIVDTGSLTKAAELLNVSHSGLSKAMGVLQDELGFKIFTPKGRGLELTERGKQLYEQSRHVLQLVSALKSKSSGIEQVLKVGLPEVLALAMSDRIATEFPQGVSIEDLDSGELEARLLERKIDFAFTFIPFPHRDLEHLKVGSIQLSSFCLGHSFSKLEPESIPYVIPAHEMRDNPLSIKIRDGWNLQLERNTPYRANSLAIALRMVQSGACAIYAPNFLIEHWNESLPKNKHLLPIEQSSQRRHHERSSRDVYLIKRQADEESKEMKSVTKVLRQLFKGN